LTSTTPDDNEPVKLPPMVTVPLSEPLPLKSVSCVKVPSTTRVTDIGFVAIGSLLEKSRTSMVTAC
jgi:hypothetical protein